MQPLQLTILNFLTGLPYNPTFCTTPDLFHLGQWPASVDGFRETNICVGKTVKTRIRSRMHAKPYPLCPSPPKTPFNPLHHSDPLPPPPRLWPQLMEFGRQMYAMGRHAFALACILRRTHLHPCSSANWSTLDFQVQTSPVVLATVEFLSKFVLCIVFNWI